MSGWYRERLSDGAKMGGKPLPYIQTYQANGIEKPQFLQREAEDKQHGWIEGNGKCRDGVDREKPNTRKTTKKKLFNHAP